MIDVLLTIMLLAVATVVVAFCVAVTAVVLRAAFKPKSVEPSDRITVEVDEEDSRRRAPVADPRLTDDIFDV